VASAALGHVLFGDFEVALTTSLLVGSIPGVYLGAQLSSRAPGWLVRRSLSVVLLASGLKLLGVPTLPLGVVLGAAVLIGPLAWAAIRRREGRRAISHAVA
jgi:hypothetical protein